ncbi:LPS-assembly protein [Lutimaribacter pacificus]|uniref:LPS-assembly protein LptD n=1 Tax=Lutimaribacter pacificus TaxID=391948 RepID=A0A1H0A5T7_9RHOB|nr:LPS assembly protein LptD [Lutimaribacter pacificus]SDN28817.1 LPS-assembly protein [Lutimaribacter pacificus]SHJ72997.1 LPS-assembly protein [Lutimaribacter pacificus]
MRLRWIVALAAWLIAAGLPAAAQTARDAPAVLVADRVEITGDDRLIAEGNVEALYGESRLKAERIIYDQKTDELILDGPVMLIEGPDAVLLADSGELDADMRNGLLRGARMILSRRVQIASPRLDRVGGRYTQLYRAAATSCRVCNADTPPIWQIRARRAVHDREARQIYFDSAQLRVLDIPIFWLPRLRLPDPTLDRATGFMIPSLNQDSQLGTGVRIPYFIRIGDHRDLTLTPFLSDNSRTLELRYRQAFHNGDLTVNGAISRDEMVDGTRGYVFARGGFDLPRDFRLSFDLEAATDRAYLEVYNYSWKDRLDSAISLSRTQRDEYVNARVVAYQTLRARENNSQIPTLVGEVEYERRLFPRRIGGEIRMAYGFFGYRRYSDLDILGRDGARAEADLSWQRSWTLPQGIQARVETGMAVDMFRILQDSSYAGTESQVTPRAGLTLRWPLVKQEAGGGTQVLEPVAMLGWVGGANPDVPIDESALVEFDEGNLLSLSRFPAADRRERGLSAAYGVSWTRYDPRGWSAGLTLGHVLRDEAQDDFAGTSGLDGTSSNLLLAGQYRSAGGISLIGRTLFDTDLDLTRAEARAAWIRPNIGLGASYIWMDEDPSEWRTGSVSEWSLDGSYRISRHWTGTANWRYEVGANRSTEAGLGMRYRNECVDVNLSLSRRFTSSSIVDPSTEVGITVGLRGFSAQGFNNSYTRTCRN